MPTALHVWPSAGLPLHLPLGANREGLHQRCRLPRHRLPAAKHAGLAAPSPNRNLLPLQSEFVFSGGTKHLKLSSTYKIGLLFLFWDQTLGSVMENLPHTNTAELLISLVCLAVLVPVKEVNTRYRQRLRTPIPVEILTVSPFGGNIWLAFGTL